jgi:hypothetical protein
VRAVRETFRRETYGLVVSLTFSRIPNFEISIASARDKEVGCLVVVYTKDVAFVSS